MESKSTNSEGLAWRNFLQPLVAALVSLVTALTITYTATPGDDMSERLSKLEVATEVLQTKVAGIDELRVEVRDLSANINKLIGTVEVLVNRKQK